DPIQARSPALHVHSGLLDLKRATGGLAIMFKLFLLAGPDLAQQLHDRILMRAHQVARSESASGAPSRLARRSSSTSVSSKACIFPNGHAFGPSLSALSGSGWVSMKMPAMPTATAARASTGTNSRWPPLLPSAPPGNCTEWVASKTTGHAVSRMTASERMSETRLL